MAKEMTDDLNKRIGVLARRETEARILIPVIEAMSKAFGKAQVTDILRETIVEIARAQGAEMAAEFGDDAAAFKETMQFWQQDNALEIDMLEQTDTKLDYNVTRCRYAEMYRALGVPELGALLSCNRDGSLIEGFNPNAKLTRTKTLMGGADHCNFRYDFSVAESE